MKSLLAPPKKKFNRMTSLSIISWYFYS